MNTLELEKAYKYYYEIKKELVKEMTE